MWFSLEPNIPYKSVFQNNMQIQIFVITKEVFNKIWFPDFLLDLRSIFKCKEYKNC